MKKLTNKRGFTLIEVVLVLAIGGLIFLLAFVAFQQVSRNRRDTQRRSDAGRMIAELQNYKGDTNAYPLDVSVGGAAGTTTIDGPTAETFINTYMGGANFKDPQGNAYSVVASTATPVAATSSATQVTYKNNHKCVNGVATSGNPGNIAVVIGLESGSICRDDS